MTVDEIGFMEYLQSAKAEFIKEVLAQEWNTKLRTTAESFIIAFDQAYAALSPISDSNEAETK